jgi:hypothetical protein
VAVAAADWNPAAMRTEMNNQDIGFILEEAETGQLSEWKYIDNRVTGNPPTDSEK